MDPIFAIRGLLSFVSFTEFTNALRMFAPHTEEKLFFSLKLEVDAERTLCHAYGLLSLLVGLVIIQAAFFAHYRPLVALALCAESFKVIFLVSEAFIFGSIPTGHQLIFPVVTGIVTILSTALLLFLTADRLSDEDENEELARAKRKLRKNK